MTFEEELANLINRHSLGNKSNTPDFILAQYIAGCLLVFETAIQQRENWYGRDPSETPTDCETDCYSPLEIVRRPLL